MAYLVGGAEDRRGRLEGDLSFAELGLLSPTWIPPLALLTLGIAWFFVSMLMLVITSSIVTGFQIHGFWTLVEATLVVWIVNLLLDFTPGYVAAHGEAQAAAPVPATRACLSAG